MPVIIFLSCFVNFVDFGGRPPDAGSDGAVFSSKSPKAGAPLPSRRGPSLQQIIKRLAQGFIDLGHWAERALASPPLSWASPPVWWMAASQSDAARSPPARARFAGAIGFTINCSKCFLFVSAGPPHLRQNRSTGQSRKEFFCSFGLKKHLSSICFASPSGDHKRKIKCFFSFLKTQKRLSSCNIARAGRGAPPPPPAVCPT